MMEFVVHVLGVADGAAPKTTETFLNLIAKAKIVDKLIQAKEKE